MNPFKSGSAPIDWCENNYVISGHIAEFYNTISNVLFFILPPILMYLFMPYAKLFSQSIQLVWILLFMIGIFSTYFHATLSLAGQLLDELAILWFILVVFTLWYPRCFLPRPLQINKNRFKLVIFGIGVVGTYLSCVAPAINAFVLMGFGIPATILLIQELKKCKCERVYRLGIRSGFTWALALGSWIIDRVFCQPYLSTTFPYLHSLWHVFIVLASYGICVLFAYFHALREAPLTIGIPVLKYYPEVFQYIFLSSPKKYLSMQNRVQKFHNNQLIEKIKNFYKPLYKQDGIINLLFIDNVMYMIKLFIYNFELARIPFVTFLPLYDLPQQSIDLVIYKDQETTQPLENMNGDIKQLCDYSNIIGCFCLGCRCNIRNNLDNAKISQFNF